MIDMLQNSVLVTAGFIALYVVGAITAHAGRRLGAPLFHRLLPLTWGMNVDPEKIDPPPSSETIAKDRQDMTQGFGVALAFVLLSALFFLEIENVNGGGKGSFLIFLELVGKALTEEVLVLGMLRGVVAVVP